MIKPMPNWIAIKAAPRPTSIGSILLPDQYLLAERKSEQTAIVMAVPDRCYTKKNKPIPCPVKPGDRILFRGFLKDLNKVSDGEEEYALLHHQDLLAIVEDPDISVGVYGLST
jgi:co-chaperonin GroES (HSP10)